MDDVQIRITDRDEVTKYNELTAWLNGNRDFRGRVTRVTGPTSDGQLGGIVDMIAVTLGSGGAGVMLAQSLAIWLRNQRADITITVTRGKKKITVSVQRVSDPLSLLLNVLGGTDEP